MTTKQNDSKSCFKEHLKFAPILIVESCFKIVYVCSRDIVEILLEIENQRENFSEFYQNLGRRKPAADGIHHIFHSVAVNLKR